MIYPKLAEQREEEDDFDPSAIWAIWGDYTLVHKQMGSVTVKLTLPCLVRNLIDPRKDAVWVEVDGDVQLVYRCDLEMDEE